jgi:hypothetical protein
MFNVNSLKKMSLLPILLISLGQFSYADDVTDTISEAVESYKSGEFSNAVEDLNYALELIKQKKSEGLKDYLPKPLTGWSAKDASSQTAGSGMFGGGLSTERVYTKDKSRIKVQIMADSPILQGMMGLFTNPMFATSDGGKLERINRQKAIVKYNKERQKGDIKIVVAKRFMVTVEGSKVSREDLISYAKGIDYRKMAKMP